MIAREPFRFSVAQYDEMIEAGILNENDAVELIRGEVVSKMPIGSRHAACVKRLNESLARALGGEAMLGVQDPILLADSEPEPDISVLKRRDDYYADAKPGPADVLLVIEVADTTLEFDRENKFSIYAEAGIAEYWIVNLQDDVVEVYRNPAGMSYRSQSVARRGDSILLLHLPKVAIAVSDILPS